MVAVKPDDIRMAVINGERPDVNLISGPETLAPVAIGWVNSCWHQSPDDRPTFAGIYHINLCFV